MNIVKLLTALAVLACGTASATILTFDAGVSNYELMPQDYGDNVTSTNMGAYSYGEAGEGFTPNVTVEYIGVGDGLHYWHNSYGDLIGVLENEDDGERWTIVHFEAETAHQVTLHSLDMGIYGTGLIPIDSMTITNESGAVPFQQNNMAIDGSTSGHTNINFGAVTGQSLTLILDLQTAAATSDNDTIGLDNIIISESWDPAVARWVAPAEDGLSRVRVQGTYPAGVQEVLVKYNNTTLYSSTNSLSFDFEQMVEPGDELLVYGLSASGIVQTAESLSFTTLKENLTFTTLDDCDGEYMSWAWEAVPGETWSGLKQVTESPSNSVMTGADFMYYRKASYRNLPFSVTTNTHMSIQYFSKLGPKVKSDSSGFSGITLSDHSFTNDGARFFEFGMGAHAPTSDDAYLRIYDAEETPVHSTVSPDINTWVEFRLDFDFSYVGPDGKYGLCSVFMKMEGATQWSAVAGLTQVEMKIDDPASITKLGGIGHCSWSSYWGYFGFQPFLDDIRFCTGENANRGAGTNLLIRPSFDLYDTTWRRDGQGRTDISYSSLPHNLPYHNGPYVTCRSSYTAEVYQVINLLNEGLTAEDIDAGIYRASFGGWQFGGNGSAGQIEIEYLDMNEQPISTNSLPVVENTGGAWVEQMATNTVPPSTRSIRYRTELSGYARLDDAHLSILGIPMDDVALTVASIHGSPVPSIGTTSNAWGTEVTCSVAHVNAGTTQYECIGWTGTGSVPTSGTSNSVEVTLTEDSSITWNWATNYLLDINITGSGSVDPDEAFFLAGSVQTLTATKDEGWLFMGWSGDASGTNDAFIMMDGPKAVTATFSDDADGDGLLNSNETAIGSNPWKSDTDGDGFDDKLEVDHNWNPTVSDQWVVDHIAANVDAFGLYPSNAVLDVAMGEMLMDVAGTEATLSLQLETSDDLQSWSNAGPAQVWSWTVDGEKKYFRVRSSK
ncbi:hypothetical protein PDESU_05633 [Pontiella desulfatans]|uniref:Bacterial repeat domain-containing protein n=1 Tax=Pontiella desulfatans TaxID=2750659 RepID=A0A6C2UAV6_PONDE|nr:hypothetical protein [Pontiella desulfatans]VGO17039.1 hypothetical protein PDESU_05633 [Pontiella desulfatans]